MIFLRQVFDPLQFFNSHILCIFLNVILDIFVSMSMNRTSDKNLTSSLRNNVRQLTEKTQQLETNARAAIRRLPVVLNEQQIKRLKEHQYASEGTTLFDPYMQIFWKWLVEFCPLWVAPNLLTTIGLVLNIGTSVLLMFLTNGGKEQVKKIFIFENKKNKFIFYLVFRMDVFFDSIGPFYISIIGCY